MENRNFVNLNVNPCKMCMPLGAALAFKGIKKSILMLHGSQGCSTYMRRYISTHYDEPMDIASSSLTEKGTVYGGEENLTQGLKNVIKLYDPEVIGVATTCLAGTIGEDINRLVKEYIAKEDIEDISIIPVETPGYESSQFDGYYVTVKKIIDQFAAAEEKTEKINIIAGNLTPADIRRIKSLMELFGLEYNLIPDISVTFDAPYDNDFEKLPPGGSKLEDIKEAGGARATIEFGKLVTEELSPGKLLEEKFDVPLYCLPLPIGLDSTDQFINLLVELSGSKPGEKLQAARGRMLDGMIDSHKYNGQGRAAIFGNPEVVYAVTKLCLENGITPALIATGSQSEKLKQLLKQEDEFKEEESTILDDTDFEKIREMANGLNVNLLLGHSKGNFITEKDGIPLVRVGFPIHDRVGAQRKVYVGYKGSINFLDRITNKLLANKYGTYREDMFDEFYPRKERG